MKRLQDGEIEWLEFELLAGLPRLRHGVFLRAGGVSSGPFDSLNTGRDVGDQEASVCDNMSRIDKIVEDCSGRKVRRVHGTGVHGKRIVEVHLGSEIEIANCDGLLTKQTGVALMMRHADCQVALMYDPKLHCAANIHSGWRGNVLNIYKEAVHLMKDCFGSDPANLLVGISPSLGPDHAEFIHFREMLPKDFWPFQIRPAYFDFWAIAKYQLQSAGVLPHHIEIASLCTYSNPRDFFSYRRDSITGRHSSYILLL